MDRLEITPAIRDKALVVYRQLDALGRLPPAVKDDYQKCLGLLRADIDNQFLRRTLVRTFFSFCDAVLFSFRCYCHPLRGNFISLIHSDPYPKPPKLLERLSNPLDPADVLLLRERTPEITNVGAVRLRPVFSAPDRAVRFTFAIVKRAWALAFEPDYSASGWNAFQQSIRIRNRLTHPRSPEQIKVSEEDLDVIFSAQKWFNNSYYSIQIELLDILDWVNSRQDVFTPNNRA